MDECLIIINWNETKLHVDKARWWVRYVNVYRRLEVQTKLTGAY